MTQSEFIMNISDNKNLINENTLNYKEKDYNRIIDILTIICKSIEIIPEIVFEKIELLDDEYENNQMIRNIPIENSRIIKLRIHFKLIDSDGNIQLTEDGEEIRPKIDLLIPRLINGTFIIDDVTYHPMLQILDYKSLVKENLVTIKTLINKMRMEIKRSRNKRRRIQLELFKRKDMPLWLVLFSLYNPIEAMQRVFKTDKIYFYDNKDMTIKDSELTNDMVMFGSKIIKIGSPFGEESKFNELLEDPKNKDFKFSMEVMLESLKEFVVHKNVVAFINRYTQKVPLEEFMKDSEPFVKILGSFYSSNMNKFVTKGYSVCHSLNRFLDDISKMYMKVNDLLEMYMVELERINAYNIALETMDEETIENNMANNLLNKRVRMSEYIIYPFTKRLSENMHSILNGNTKDNIRTNKILNIFKINKNIIVKYLMTNNLIRYNDQSNLMSAIANTKASFITSETANNISANLRAVPISGLRRIDIITTPTGSSVGLTVNLSATNKNLLDENGIII